MPFRNLQELHLLLQVREAVLRRPTHLMQSGVHSGNGSHEAGNSVREIFVSFH